MALQLLQTLHCCHCLLLKWFRNEAPGPDLDFIFQVLVTDDHLKYHQILKYLNHPLDPQELCQQLVTGHGKEGRGQNEVELIGSA